LQSYYCSLHSRGWDPICISKMSIGKNYMWISAAPEVKHNIRFDCKNRSIAGSVFIFLNIYLKFNPFFKKKSKCDSNRLTLLYITHFCFGFLCSHHRDILSVVGSGVSKTCNVNEENVTKRTKKPEILQNLTTDRCLTFRQILI
jgi:hypothetical protein